MYEAYRGNLKIVKDSSDGRKDGFAFEVKSKDGTYCETFTTPENGVIEITGLRIGTYTVTENRNKASEDYIIPDGATVEIKTGETAVVQFFNEKPEKPEKPDTPDTPDSPNTPNTPDTPKKPVPQTGDNYNLYLWAGIFALALAGTGVSFFFCIRKGNNKKYRIAAGSVLLAFAAGTIGSAFLLSGEISQYQKSAKAYGGLQQYVEELPVEEKTLEGSAGSSETELPSVNFEELLQKGPDVKAWLSIPDTVINYPVVQGKDNDYYLKHLYDGTENKTGSLFLDYENKPKFTDRNSIIYGHNMLDP